jgi:hypothetical protein
MTIKAKPRATYVVGQRVQLHPGSYRWVLGNRYGEVIKVNRTNIEVRLDKSGTVAKLHPSQIAEMNKSASG